MGIPTAILHPEPTAVKVTTDRFHLVDRIMISVPAVDADCQRPDAQV